MLQSKEHTENVTAQEVQKEEMTMITMKINGMMCPHCQAAVKKALEAFEGVSADVNLRRKQSYISASKEVDREALKQAVVEAGYEVVSVE